MTVQQTGKHLLMASMPAAGHVYPHLEVIRALVDAGYRVSYLMGEGFKSVVESTGAEFLGYESAFPRLGGASKPDLPEAAPEPAFNTDMKNINPITGMQFLARDTAAMLPVLKELFATDRPDLVLYGSGAPVAGAYAESLGIPAIAMVSAFAFWQGAEEEMLARMGDFSPDDPQLLELKEYQRSVLSEYGLEDSAGQMGFLVPPKQALVFIPEALQPHPEKVDRSIYHFAGAAVSDSQSDADWQLPEDKKVLLVSLGSTFTRNIPFYKACIEAFGTLSDWHVVLQVGPLVELAELGEIPPNFEVHPWVPQVAILKHAEVFLTHAGMGGSREGLSLGVPMIAAPQAVDQFQNADSLVAAGVAAKVDGTSATARDLLDALETVQSDLVKQRSAQVAEEMAGQDSIRFSLDFIHSALQAS